MTVNSTPPLGAPAQPYGTIHYHVLWGRAYLGMAALAPVLTIDGERVVVNPGAQALRLPAGHHRLSCGVLSPQGMTGHATLDVNLAPGAVLDVFHTIQMFFKNPGKLDLRPQRPGGTGLIVLLTVFGIFCFFSLVYSAVTFATLGR